MNLTDDAAAEAQRLCKEEGYTFVHTFDGPYVIVEEDEICIGKLKREGFSVK